jgi:molybdopterin converting factor small subunit
MEKVPVRVQLFGALRKYSNGSDVAFDVPRGTTVSALRRHLVEALRRGCAAFAGQDLVNASVLADESRILDESQPLGHGVDEVLIAALPPVCGG